jgi:hypothetical protein
MMGTSLEKELRSIRERLNSIEDALGEEMSEDDKKARAEAVREHREGKTLPLTRTPVETSASASPHENALNFSISPYMRTNSNGLIVDSGPCPDSPDKGG